MLQKLKNRKSEGFTIIEVLIVLAIAGLILVVVLLAVPALQRNSRNTTMKNDVSAISGGITEFESNNDGQLPAIGPSPGTFQSGSNLSVNKDGTTTASEVKVQGSDVITTQKTAAVITPKAGEVKIVYGYSCNAGLAAGTATAPTWTPVTVSARAASIVYVNEVAGGLQVKCADA